MRQQQWGWLALLGCVLSNTTVQASTMGYLPPQAPLNPQGMELASPPPLSEITPVFQLRDVAPTDWAREALQNLMERYNCLQGYPDNTFRGERPLTRYEFAASLAACFSQLPTLQGEDLLTVERLRQEFVEELEDVATFIHTLEGRLRTLEDQSFSTTVIFGGQVVFALSGATGGRPPGRGETGILFTHQTQLALATSFQGKDRLLLGLGTGNFNDFGFANPKALNSYMALLNSQSGARDQWSLDTLEYRRVVFKDRMVLTLKPVGFSLGDVLTPNTPHRGAGDGAVSRFGAQNPLFQLGALNSGVGLDWLVSDQVRLQTAYGTRNSAEGGFFNGSHSALGVQVLVAPGDRTVAGLAYVNAYSQDGRLDTFTGSFNADTSGTFLEPAQIHGLGATLQTYLTDNIILGAWGGITYTRSLVSPAFALSATGTLSFGIEDPFGKTGDYWGIVAGIPPKLLVGGNIERRDRGTSFHLETFYRWRISDRLSISPGVFLVTDPGHISNNNTFWIGTVRANFQF
ncbi:iron uptake porin [Spirulina subsalsa FACHB-351]|uniref:Iron uptake porin n=1 Tax=Spirulina subsalsa FACHB-351 TaxID=234711 RepID=A0ABT3L440_9CYAN|nr:iron uptake porin [Spirulina subsalsa]MCW6036273.1 iron uptake porin [Spirulina subsalsa FACHB-351]